MAAKSKIEWCTASWTPLRARVKTDAAKIAREKGYTSLVQIAGRMAGRVGPHCEKVSPECAHCYSETSNARCLPHNGTGLPFDRRSRDLIEPIIDDKILKQPLLWREPQRIFVCSQTDLFGEWVPDEMIAEVWGVMYKVQRHTYQVLTKRHERMASMVPWLVKTFGVLPNVWLGVSVGDRSHSQRIDFLRTIPAAVRFVSFEPLLEDLGDLDLHGIHLAIWGGESGKHARRCDMYWILSGMKWSESYGCLNFVKQLGANSWIEHQQYHLNDPKGGDPNEWPQDLRVRQLPQEETNGPRTH